MGSFSRAAVAEVTEEMLRRGLAFSPGCALGELGFSYYSHWLAISAKWFSDFYSLFLIPSDHGSGSGGGWYT